MNRFEELNKIFELLDVDIKKTINPLIAEVVFLENQMKELRKLPFIRINPKDSSQQKTTPAAKLYKECSQSYMNAIRILCSLLHKVDNSAENELLKKLSEFNL
mgnify:CR=1 FL=1